MSFGGDVSWFARVMVLLCGSTGDAEADKEHACSGRTEEALVCRAPGGSSAIPSLPRAVWDSWVCRTPEGSSGILSLSP